MDHVYPVQLDALMGYASVIQDMVLQYHNGHVYDHSFRCAQGTKGNETRMP